MKILYANTLAHVLSCDTDTAQLIKYFVSGSGLG